MRRSYRENINRTGRIPIPPECVRIIITEESQDEHLHIKLKVVDGENFSWEEFKDREFALYVEARRGSWVVYPDQLKEKEEELSGEKAKELFHELVKNKKEVCLTFPRELEEQMKMGAVFNLFVVEEQGGKPWIRAGAFRLVPEGYQESMVPVVLAETDPLLWRISWEEDDEGKTPVLEINNKAPELKDFLVQKAVYRALVLPAVLREILVYLEKEIQKGGGRF